MNTAKTIRLPVNIHEDTNKINKYEDEVNAHNGVKPTTDELAIATNLPVSRIINALATRSTTIFSLDAERHSGSQESMSALRDLILDTSTDSDPLHDALEYDRHKQIKSALLQRSEDGTLVIPERTLMVLLLRHGLNVPGLLTKEEIDKVITSSHNRRLYRKNANKPVLTHEEKLKLIKENSEFAESMTLEKVGKILNLSRQRVLQLERKGLELLRNPQNFRILEELL